MQVMSGRVLLFERNNINETSLTNLRECPGNTMAALPRFSA